MHATLSAPNPAACHTAFTGAFWTLMGKSGSVSCGVTASFFWVLVHTDSVCALQGSVSPVLYKFWQLCGGVNFSLLQGACAIPRSTASRAPAPAAVHCSPVLLQETLRHNSGLVSFGSLGPGAHKKLVCTLSVVFLD